MAVPEKAQQTFVGRTFRERTSYLPVHTRMDLMGLPGLLTDSFIDPLIRLSDSLKNTMGPEGRKVTYQFDPALASDHSQPRPDDIPEEILHAMRAFNSYFGFPINTAVLKRYDKEDDYTSAAYDLHADPEKFEEQPIALISLSGFANLTVETSSGNQHTLPCTPGTLMLCSPDILHQISPPLNESGIRHFLFFGYNNELARKTA